MLCPRSSLKTPPEQICLSGADSTGHYNKLLADWSIRFAAGAVQSADAAFLEHLFFSCSDSAADHCYPAMSRIPQSLSEASGPPLTATW
jgi:hypothetical protein